MKLVYDIETDGLLHDCTRMWILRAEDVTTKEKYRFLEGDFGWKELFNNAEMLIGHNIISYDNMVLKKLFNYDISPDVKVVDTLLLSMILDYMRFKGRGHSLERWGEALGYPKIDYHDWSQYSEEMDIYCEQDVSLNVRVLANLNREFQLAPNRELLSKYIRCEHIAATFVAKANLKGWRINMEKAITLRDKLEAEKAAIVEALEADLGIRAVATDLKLGDVKVHEPKFTKYGTYVKYQADWFGIQPEDAYQEDESKDILGGAYCRVEFRPLKLNSVADVKVYLFRLGWIPTQFNVKILEDNSRVNTTPKITEDSIEFLGDKGRMYLDYLTISSRLSIVKTWVEEEKNGRVHGDCFTIGTPSMRARHSIIVNVPAVKSKYGAEMRDLFIADEGKKIIGADSAGNQARGLAHFINDESFTKLLLEEDIHQFNANALTEVLRDSLQMDHEVSRDRAKRILYAFLFGASGAKLWSYVFDYFDPDKGNILKDGFTAKVPGFKALVDSLNKEFKNSKVIKDGKRDKNGYIRSLAGNKLWIGGKHKLLVYLLQSAEKITCCSAIKWFSEKMEEEGIPYEPLIFYHDEIQFQVDEIYAERSAEIAAMAFKEGPKEFGVTIMDGEAKIGNSWYETH